MRSTYYRYLRAVESLARGNWGYAVFVIFKLEINFVCIDRCQWCNSGWRDLNFIVKIKINLVLIFRRCLRDASRFRWQLLRLFL